MNDSTFALIFSLFFSGGPDRCEENESFPQNISCNLNTLKQQSVTLCGNPQPQLEWKVGTRVINGTVDESLRRQHRYTYRVAFESLTHSVCGKVFSYVAIGYKGESTFEEMLILPRPGI